LFLPDVNKYADQKLFYHLKFLKSPVSKMLNLNANHNKYFVTAGRRKTIVSSKRRYKIFLKPIKVNHSLDLTLAN